MRDVASRIELLQIRRQPNEDQLPKQRFEYQIEIQRQQYEYQIEMQRRQYEYQIEMQKQGILFIEIK